MNGLKKGLKDVALLPQNFERSSSYRCRESTNIFVPVSNLVRNITLSVFNFFSDAYPQMLRGQNMIGSFGRQRSVLCKHELLAISARQKNCRHQKKIRYKL